MPAPAAYRARPCASSWPWIFPKLCARPWSNAPRNSRRLAAAALGAPRRRARHAEIHRRGSRRVALKTSGSHSPRFTACRPWSCVSRSGLLSERQAAARLLGGHRGADRSSPNWPQPSRRARAARHRARSARIPSSPDAGEIRARPKVSIRCAPPSPNWALPNSAAPRPREFYLYQSVLKRSGAEYTRLATLRTFTGDRVLIASPGLLLDAGRVRRSSRPCCVADSRRARICWARFPSAI